MRCVRAPFVIAMIAALLGVPCSGEAADPLATLRAGHPRLIALDSDIERVRELIKSDRLAKKLYERLAEDARAFVAEPTTEEGGRNFRNQVYTLALLYRLSADRRYADRAVKELRAAAARPHWNPSHFLDTAQMTQAFAIGYDWLYPALSAADREVIRTAIVEKGLKEALPIYEGRRPYPDSRMWAEMNHNWNLLCNAGVVLGALAIADEMPDLSRRVVERALQSVPRALALYAPDGGSPEGPGYWHVATRGAVFLMAGLQTALGTDFGLSSTEGFDRAGHFAVHVVGPTGKSFNYADAAERVNPGAHMFWLAQKFAQPTYAWQQHVLLEGAARPTAFDLIWYEPSATPPDKAGWSPSTCFDGVGVGFLRTSWEDPMALFVGVKGGNNMANHSHLDLGSFVLDAGGERWALDLGAESYRVPGYFEILRGGRWALYRASTAAHNTIVLDGQNQAADAKACIVDCGAKAEDPYVVLDLSEAYPGKVGRFERTVALVERRAVLVEDVIEPKRPVEAVWGMTTDAEVTIRGGTAELVKGDWTLSVEVFAPTGTRFEVVSTTPPKPQTQNEGTRRLVVRLPNRVTGRLDMRVLLTPYRTGQAKPEVMTLGRK